MVRTLLFCALASLSFAASSQDVRISWEDDYSMPYNGEEVTISGSESTIYTNFYVVNESAESTFIWRRDILSPGSPGFDDQLCDDQICYTTSGVSWVCPGPLTISAGDSSLFQPKLLTNGYGGTAHMRYFVLDENENKLDSLDVVFTSTASLNNLSMEDFNVYPNPANNDLTIENLSASDRAIHIYDALGKNIFTSTVSAASIQLNLSDLKSGIYFVRVEKNNGALTEPKKLVVKK